MGSTTEAGAPSFTAAELLAFEDNFVSEGVLKKGGTELKVVENGIPNMTVTVKAGRALVDITTAYLSNNESYPAYAYITADEVLNITTADVTHPRIDRVVLRFDVSQNPNAAASNPPVILEVLAGTPAGSPSAPAEPSNAITLATISVPAGDTTIANAQITDARPYAELNSDGLMGLARVEDLASTASGKGASQIGVEDSGGNFTGTTVEAVLAEIQTELLAEINSKIDIVNIGFYGDESDGVPTWTSGATLDPSTAKRYSSATLPVSQTLTVSPVNVPLIVNITGDVTINGTIDLNGKGAAGSSGGASTANSTAATAGASLVSGYTTGGGGIATSASNNGGGGGGGASAVESGVAGVNGSNGLGGSAGTVITAQKLALLAAMGFRGVVCGAGGSGGGGGNGAAGGAGGAGGGAMLMMIGGNLTLGAASVIRANGVNGSNGAGTAAGGGGGGGGGTVIILVSGSITNGGVTVSASGGSAGTGNGVGGNGGAGAAGRVVIYSLSTGTLITA